MPLLQHHPKDKARKHKVAQTLYEITGGGLDKLTCMIEDHWKEPYGYKSDCHRCQTEINDNIRDAIKRNDKKMAYLFLMVAQKAGIRVWTYIPDSFKLEKLFEAQEVI